MADAEPVPPPSVAPNKAALALIGGAAAGLGVLPYLLWVDRLAYLWLLVPAALALSLLGLRGFQTAAASAPSAPEWLLGGWSALFMPASGSLTGLLMYGLGYGLQRLLAWALAAVGLAPLGGAPAWGFWASVWFVLMAAAVGCSQQLPEVARQLYPREAWSRSSFQPLLARKPLLLLVGLAGLLALAAMLWWLDWHGRALPILMALLLFYTSFPLAELRRPRPDRVQAAAVAALDRLLTQQGYRVQRRPRTGKPETDPLLQSVDLLARGPAQVYAVELRAVASAAPVEWQAANAVRTAATVLGEEPGPGGVPALPVQPLLVVLGGSVAPSLSAFAQRERVLLVHLASPGEAVGDQGALQRQLRAAGVVLPEAAAAPAASSSQEP